MPPSDSLDADVENLRVTYAGFREILEKFCAVNRIQMTITYVFGCCMVLASTYFAISSTPSGKLATTVITRSESFT
jgi:hypothetical protein